MINDELDNFYNKYYDPHDIVRCGLIDENLYKVAKHKIVFILREANTYDEVTQKHELNWSIPGELNRIIKDYHLKGTPLVPGFMKTWRQAGVWAYSIINGFSSYETLKDDKYVSQGLQAIGMTNLKKTGGGSRSNKREISLYAYRDRHIWIQELKIMNPDLIICGGTYGDVQKCLGLNEKILYRVDQRIYYYSVYPTQDKEWIFLEFCHPQSSIYGLLQSRQAILLELEILIKELEKSKVLT